MQLQHVEHGRRLAIVNEPFLSIIEPYETCYDIALAAIAQGKRLTQLLQEGVSSVQMDYDLIYQGDSDWRLLPAFDHPYDPLHCMLSGTGLTHKASAENRQKMHMAQQSSVETDSMKMYRWGEEGGKVPPGQIGVQPEWFYKGNGTSLRAHGAALSVPNYADDGGEEPEVAGVYIIDERGRPWRIGFCTANEFSDHQMEKKNYLYLAPSKIRNCAIGPELVIDIDFDDIIGKVGIIRETESMWRRTIKTGEKNMAHSLSNLEYHHFKYANHRQPGQVHIHFFGADAFSFGEGWVLQDGDMMEVQWEGLGRPLKNYLVVDEGEEHMVSVQTMR